MNNHIEMHLIRQKSEELKNLIDFQILTEASGWTMVDFGYWTSNRDAVDITNWLEENCESEWRMFGHQFAFESAKDATAFSLKWL